MEKEDLLTKTVKPIKEIFIKFEDIDDWNRPVYKDVNTTIRYGDVNKLWVYRELGKENNIINAYYKNNIKALEYFGGSFNCEPHGGISKHYKLIIQN